MSPLVRQWIVLKSLCSRNQGITVRDLAREMEVSEKTIRRDLSTFLEAGLPIQESTRDGGVKWWRLDPAASRADLTFTFDEALALYLGQRYLTPLVGTELWTAATRAFRKVRASLGERATAYLTKFRDVISETHFAKADYSGKSEVIDNLMLGIEDRRVVFITYRSQRSTEPVTYDVHPYRFTRHQQSLYLQGLKPDDDDVRTWKVDRIDRAEVDQMRFTIPDELNLDDLLSGSFGIFESGQREPQIIIVRFSRAVARYVTESTWHPSQQIERTADGVNLKFELREFEELKSWVLGFGRHAEVLAPNSLRAELAAETASLAAIYAQQQPQEDE